MTTVVDFEDLIDRQQADESGPRVLWIDIEQKHLDRISRAWTIICIITQLGVFICIITSYMYVGLVDYHGSNSVLTPLFFKSNDKKGEIRRFYFYAIFTASIGDPDEWCPKAINTSLDDYDCICDNI